MQPKYRAATSTNVGAAHDGVSINSIRPGGEVVDLGGIW
jgi:hypothetical protein